MQLRGEVVGSVGSLFGLVSLVLAVRDVTLSGGHEEGTVDRSVAERLASVSCDKSPLLQIQREEPRSIDTRLSYTTECRDPKQPVSKSRSYT